MKKIIFLLLCCGILVSMVGCGGNTAPPPTESPPTTVSEAIIMETPIETAPPVTAVEPIEEEKESIPTETTDQIVEPTVTVAEPTEETTTNVTNTAEEKTTPPIEETVQSTTPQLAESETAVANPPKEEPKAETVQETAPEPETTPPKFDIQYWLTFAKDYAVYIGLTLDSAAVECWDNPIRAGAHCLYLERDIQSRLNRYAKDEDITDVWIWAEAMGKDCYDIYIGYA